jgi:HCOMODA/2-hydroxy-3-carboxy-muconic semialdehyde decarboxylase
LAEIVGKFGKLGEPLEATQRRVRMAARALGRNDLGHAFGHVSARLDDKSFLVCAPRPMGLIPEGEPGTVVPIDGALPQGVLGEVRIHQQIYKRRADVNGICRTFLRQTMALSALRRTPLPRDGFGSYFAPKPALWDDPLLLRNDEAAAKLADTLGQSRAIVMRGNGAVTVGATVEEAICMAFFLEEASHTELAVLAVNRENEEAVMTQEQATARGVTTGNILERLWEYLTRGDPEIWEEGVDRLWAQLTHNDPKR